MFDVYRFLFLILRVLVCTQFFTTHSYDAVFPKAADNLHYMLINSKIPNYERSLRNKWSIQIHVLWLELSSIALTTMVKF